jgi:pyruvate/2-oxoglutarate/acetoin dehydrogenase E1 component
MSESAITGAAVGAAMMGMKPVVEIMFADFLTIAADQLLIMLQRCVTRTTVTWNAHGCEGCFRCRTSRECTIAKT